MPLNFPTLSQGQDSQFFGVERADPALSSDVEGGYVATRARFTRRPPKLYKTGYSDLTEADRAALDAFWDVCGGSAEGFYWPNPVTGVAEYVRFKPGSSLSWGYKGVRTRYRWSVQLQIETL